MSMITDVWHELVRRRLWPLAVLLLGALVAVPFLLAKDPAPAPVPATTQLPQTGAGTAADETVTATPVVALADAGAAPRRRVLGARKDPFQPAPAPKVKAAKKSVAATDTPSAGSGAGAGGASTGGGSTAGSGTSAPSSPATPAPAVKTFPANSLTVRYGSGSGGALKKSTLERLQPLMDGDNPILVYLGLRKGGKEAVFLLDASVVAQGDGRCESGASQCETLVLRTGETEFLDVTDETGAITASYELDLLAIHAAKTGAAAAAAAAAGTGTADAAKAGAARKRAAALGRRAVDGHIAANGPLRYRYDVKTGALDRLADEAYAAAVEAAAANAAGVAHVIAGL
jgi:hypothetical protein